MEQDFRDPCCHQHFEQLDGVLERFYIYDGIVRFIRQSALSPDCDDDTLINSIAAAYPPDSVVPLDRPTPEESPLLGYQIAEG